MGKKEININSLSPHLFWDVDSSTLSYDKNKAFIIKRVLDYGLIKDWQLIYQNLGIDEIANIAIDIKDLDPRSLSFISTISKIPKEKFRCYTFQQSIPKHWNF
jgi:hypothetical protein